MFYRNILLRYCLHCLFLLKLFPITKKMASQFLAYTYQGVAYPGVGPIAGGPFYNTTPVYRSFSATGTQILPKDKFERFFIQSPTTQEEPAFWTAINSVIIDPTTDGIYSSTETVAALVAKANA